MADDKNNKGDPTDEENKMNSDREDDNLENFVTEHYKKQKENGQLDATAEIDDKRAEDFFTRAIAESRRMNAEVDKSNKKSDKLREEFGVEMVNAWRAEHAAEVLTPPQMAALSITPPNQS